MLSSPIDYKTAPNYGIMLITTKTTTSEKGAINMIHQNPGSENPKFDAECEFGKAIKELGIAKILQRSNIRGKNGKSMYEIFQFLLLLVFQGRNLYHFLNSKKQDTAS